MRPAVILSIRKRSTGHRLAALACDSLDHAWAVANLIVQSPSYARCYVVGADWTGAEIFVVGISPSPELNEVRPALASTPSPGYAVTIAARAPRHAPTDCADAEVTSHAGRMPSRGW